MTFTAQELDRIAKAMAKADGIEHPTESQLWSAYRLAARRWAAAQAEADHIMQRKRLKKSLLGA